MTFTRLRWPTARGALCVMAAAGVACLLACGRRDVPEPRTVTLRLGAQKAPEALPVLTDLLYAESLLAIDWHGRPMLRLASAYQWTDDGRALQLEIRSGVRFHDGKPVTAALVTEILRRRIERQHTGSFEFVTGVENLDDRTVVIHLSRPDAFLIDALAGTMIVEPGQPDIGTGPFKLVKRAETVEAERNLSYYGGAPGIERVRITTYDTPRATWAAMMRGEVDMVPEVNRDSVEFLQGTTRFVTSSTIRPFYIPLVLNLRHPVLRSVDVRRALAEAIDRDEIVRQAMRGHGHVADDPVWPFHWAYTTASLHHAYNPAAAALRLDAAGFPVRPPSQPGGMPSRFQIRCLFWDKGAQFERIALTLQRQMAAIGVDLVLERAQQETIQERAGTGAFDTYLYQMASGKSFYWTYTFWHSPRPGARPIQDSGYTGVDGPLDRLRQARGDSDVRVALGDMRQRFYEDVPALFIAWPEATRAVDARFNVGDPSDPEVLVHISRWNVMPLQRASR